MAQRAPTRVPPNPLLSVYSTAARAPLLSCSLLVSLRRSPGWFSVLTERYKLPFFQSPQAGGGGSRQVQHNGGPHGTPLGGGLPTPPAGGFPTLPAGGFHGTPRPGFSTPPAGGFPTPPVGGFPTPPSGAFPTPGANGPPPPPFGTPGSLPQGTPGVNRPQPIGTPKAGGANAAPQGTPQAGNDGEQPGAARTGAKPTGTGAQTSVAASDAAADLARRQTPAVGGSFAPPSF
ncbi:hypothetical protein IWX50DRAFT_698360 [Phyllosticta citricarpa]